MHNRNYFFNPSFKPIYQYGFGVFQSLLVPSFDNVNVATFLKQSISDIIFE